MGKAVAEGEVTQEVVTAVAKAAATRAGRVGLVMMVVATAEVAVVWVVEALVRAVIVEGAAVWATVVVVKGQVPLESEEAVVMALVDVATAKRAEAPVRVVLMVA